MPRFYSFVTLFVILIRSVEPAATADDRPPVRVFILAGQSNMEGKASNELLEHQAADPATSDQFAHLRRNGQWIVRDDVFIKFLNRSGGLTIGYGSPNRTGVELEFGTVMGDHFDEPVLLIKAAWGGHSLYQKFRPPSAGLPDENLLQQELEKKQNDTRRNNQKRNRNDPLPTMEQIRSEYGSSWRSMLAEVKTTFDNYDTMFPQLKGHRLALTGFVWFQGFNDMFGDQAPVEYAANMRHFINDVRRDLNAPQLPFVIGALGQNGSSPAAKGMLTIQNAQLSMNDVPEFSGTVKTIRTDVLADQAAERLFPGWQDHIEEWKKVGSDRPYHYLGSAIWFNRIGRKMGQTMLELIQNQP